MKKLFYLTMLTLSVFFLSHCTFQISSAEREWDHNKHLVQSDDYYSSEFQYNDVRIDGMNYRIYFGQAHYPGGVAIINKTNDILMNRKLKLEIEVLKYKLQEIKAESEPETNNNNYGYRRND